MIPISANIIFTYCLAFFVLIHNLSIQGIYKTLLVFLGICIIAGGLENLNVIFGAYYYTNSELTWLWGHCPFEVIAGWYVIFYCSSYMSHCLIGQFVHSFFSIRRGTTPEIIDKQFIKITILRAALAGYIALSLDFIMDPVAVANQWWVWQLHNLYIMGVPLSNFFAWWLLIFATTFIYDMVFSHCGIKRKTDRFTSGLWVTGIIAAAVLAGLMIDGVTHWLGMDMIRTQGIDTRPLNTSFTQEQIKGIFWTVFMLLSAIAGIMAGSLLSKICLPKKQAVFCNGLIPPVIMLLFWGWMMGVAMLTDLSFVAPSFLLGAPYIMLCIASMVIAYRHPS